MKTMNKRLLKCYSHSAIGYTCCFLREINIGLDNGMDYPSNQTLSIVYDAKSYMYMYIQTTELLCE